MVFHGEAWTYVGFQFTTRKIVRNFFFQSRKGSRTEDQNNKVIPMRDSLFQFSIIKHRRRVVKKLKKLSLLNFFAKISQIESIYKFIKVLINSQTYESSNKLTN